MMAPTSPKGSLPMPNTTNGKFKGKKGNGGAGKKKKWWRRNRIWVAVLAFIAASGASGTLWM